MGADKELIEALEEAAEYVRHTIGSSYCETDKDDEEFLAKLESLLAEHLSGEGR